MQDRIKKYIPVLFAVFLMFFSLSVLGAPGRAFAQTDQITGGLNEIRGNVPSSGLITGSQSINELIGNIIYIILGITGAIAVVFLIIGGYMYMTSAGNEEAAEKGRKTIVNALIGIVVIILSYVIVYVTVDLVSW